MTSAVLSHVYLQFILLCELADRYALDEVFVRHLSNLPLEPFFVNPWESRCFISDLTSFIPWNIDFFFKLRIYLLLSTRLQYLSPLAIHLSSFSSISILKLNLENTIGWDIPETRALLSNFYSKPLLTCSLFQYYFYQFPPSFFFVSLKIFAEKKIHLGLLLYCMILVILIASMKSFLSIIIWFKFCKVLNQVLPDFNWNIQKFSCSGCLVIKHLLSPDQFTLTLDNILATLKACFLSDNGGYKSMFQIVSLVTLNIYCLSHKMTQ